MRALFDTTLTLLVVDEQAKPPERESRSPAEARDRLDFLLERLDQQRSSIIIPTPSLTELVIRGTQEIGQLIELLSKMPRVEIAPFDRRAAMECGIMLRDRWRTGAKIQPGESWPKVKFDHQIVAIARVYGADIIYSDDGDISRLAGAGEPKIQVLGTWDLPPRPVNPQTELPLTPPAPPEGTASV